MYTVFCKEKNFNKFMEELKNLDQNPNILGLLIMSCDNNEYPEEDFNKCLKTLKTPVTGGIFPKILYKEKSYDEGYLIIGFEKNLRTFSLKNISKEETNFEEFLDGICELNEEEKTFLVFVDGFSKRITDFKDILYEYYGWSVDYIGGGAGSLSFLQKPVIITNKGLLQDAVSISILSQPVMVGVAHGWKAISKSFKVTSSNDNQVFEINNRPAFEVYKEIIEAISQHSFNKEDFFSIAKAYPFGIAKLSDEMIVVDPITKGDDNSITFVGEVPEGSYVYILHGDVNSLLEGARDAKNQAYLRYFENDRDKKPPSSTFFIDCISRVLFLGDNFDLEIKEIATNDSEVFGALTIGEIANKGENSLEFYNKTSVVALFE